MSTDIRAQLEEERRLIEEATDGPWEADPLEGDLTGPEGGFVMEVLAWRDPDAAFIAHARTALPVRTAQIEAVLALHKPTPNLNAGGFMEPDSHCKECNKGQREEAVEPWPCDTVRAIEEAGK